MNCLRRKKESCKDHISISFTFTQTMIDERGDKMTVAAFRNKPKLESTMNLDELDMRNFFFTPQKEIFQSTSEMHE